MSVGSNIKKNLLWIILGTAIAGYNPTQSQKDIFGERAAEKPSLNIKENIKSKNISKTPWKDVSEYDEFIRSTVDRYYVSDIKDIYNFYNIKKDLPKYGFKQKEEGFICFDCEGAVFKEKADSIYFYSTCSEELFDRYIEYHKKDNNDIKEELTNRIHHYIKHESAHDIYCEFGKDIGKRNLFKKITDNTPALEKIQYTLVEEGVADYISYKGELTDIAKKLGNEDFKEMIENEDDFHLYELGFILVKPILDINLEKGIKELIKYPLTKEDLNDLPGYREKRIENILKKE
jgi:hypothetical protein